MWRRIIQQKCSSIRLLPVNIQRLLFNTLRRTVIHHHKAITSMKNTLMLCLISGKTRCRIFMTSLRSQAGISSQLSSLPYQKKERHGMYFFISSFVMILMCFVWLVASLIVLEIGLVLLVTSLILKCKRLDLTLLMCERFIKMIRFWCVLYDCSELCIDVFKMISFMRLVLSLCLF